LQTLNPRRSYAASGVVSGKAYMLGGGNTIEQERYEDNDEYDPATDAWTEKTPTPSPDRMYAVAEALGSAIYLVNGNSGGFAAIPDVDEYTPGSDSWASKTSRGSSLYDLGSFNFTTVMHAFEGILSPLHDHDAYTAAGDSWASKTARTGVAFLGPNFFTIGTKGYLAGGMNRSTLAGDATHDEYDSVGDSWANKAALPSPVRHHVQGGAL
jgi:hypothetical protein